MCCSSHCHCQWSLGNMETNYTIHSGFIPLYQSLYNRLSMSHMVMSPKKTGVFLAHSLTMVLRLFLDHKISLEYRGEKKVIILLLWEKNLNTNFQKCSQMFVLICHCCGNCLIRILHSKS